MSRIKSSVKMGQGRWRRGPALALAGPQPVRWASLRLRRSRPAALGPCGLRLAGPRLQGCLAGRGRRRARRRGRGTDAAWHVRAPCSGRPRSTARRPRGSGTTAARHALAPHSGRPRSMARRLQGRGTTADLYVLAPRSGRPRSTARRLRGSGDHHCPAPAGAPLRPAEVDDVPAAEVGGLPQPGTPPIGPAEVARKHTAALRSARLKRERR